MAKKINKTETKLYGVSKAYGNYSRFEAFSYLHATEDEAIEEAKQLAQKENVTFFVVQLVIAAVPGERPVNMTAPSQLTKANDPDIPF